MKLCYRCHETKEEQDFSPGNNRCRLCHREYQKERRAKLAEKNQNVDMAGTKTCSTCKLEKPKTEYGVAKGITDGLQAQCNGCRKESRKAYNTSQKGHVQNMIVGARRRAKDKERDFSISVEEVEALWAKQNGKCAVTGREFVLDNDTDYHENSRHHLGPSIDRIECDKGYTASNIRLVTNLANVAMGAWGEEATTQMAQAIATKHGYTITPPCTPNPLQLQSLCHSGTP